MPHDEPTGKTTVSESIKPLNHPPFDGWLARKLAGGTSSIPRAARVDVYHSRCERVPDDVISREVEFGRVTLAAEPSEEFAYHSRVEWPRDPAESETAVLDGILDEILTRDHGPVVTKVRFTLEAIHWNEATSSPHAFYLAARRATNKLLSIKESHDDLLETLEDFCKRPTKWTISPEYDQITCVITGYLYALSRFGLEPNFPDVNYSIWLASKFKQSSKWIWWSIIKKVFPNDEEALENLVPLMREYLLTRHPHLQNKRDRK